MSKPVSTTPSTTNLAAGIPVAEGIPAEDIPAGELQQTNWSDSQSPQNSSHDIPEAGSPAEEDSPAEADNLAEEDNLAGEDSPAAALRNKEKTHQTNNNNSKHCSR